MTSENYFEDNMECRKWKMEDRKQTPKMATNTAAFGTVSSAAYRYFDKQQALLVF
jgi:hypothetical protein